MFSATTSGSDDLKAIISSIATLVEEATFVANAEGITFRGMDPSHVALIDILWPNTAFEKYECDSDIKFGVRIDEFSKIIGRADKKDSITLDTDDGNMLKIRMGASKTYKVRLVEISATDTPLPKITYDARIEMATSTFEKVLGDVGVVSDYLTIRAGPDAAAFSGKGDSGEASTVKSKGELQGLEAKAECEGTYSLEYLQPVVKAVRSTVESITCEFSGAKPLRIELKVANIGRIHFYLAPRVEG